MYTPIATDTTALERLAARTTLPASAKMAVQVADLLTRWADRRATRLALKSLDAHALRDVGLTRAQADHELSKPFWRA